MNLMKANLVLAIVAAVLAVPTWLTIQGESTAFVDVAQVPRLFEGFNADLVASLVLGEPKKEQPAPPPNADPNQKPQIQYDSISFQRGDKGFVLGQGMGELTGAPVQREQLDLQVMKHLAEIRSDKDALVRPDATEEQLAEYGLDPEHAFVVKAGNAQGQVIAELLVGKDTAAGQGGTDAVRGVFVRRADSRDVVLYEVPFWQRAIKPDVWLDRTVLKVTADLVRKVALKNESGEAVFARPKGRASWECAQPPEGKGALRQIEIEGLVQRLGYLQAAQILRPLPSATLNAWGLEPPRIDVQITYEQGDQERTIALGIGQVVEGKSECYLRSSDSQFAMTMPAHLVTPFERAVGEFFDPQAPAPVPDAPKDDKDASGDKKPDAPADVKKDEKKGGDEK